ncbi:MAG: hypothetical protein JW841_00540 [Deltaproteobacteria bacterium]|nr:hypothetical protein [Deltaproteobacteria bacterium]
MSANSTSHISRLTASRPNNGIPDPKPHGGSSGTEVEDDAPAKFSCSSSAAKQFESAIAKNEATYKNGVVKTICGGSAEIGNSLQLAQPNNDNTSVSLRNI